MKPIFTVHEGEFLVGDYINRKLGKKYEVWVPTKDTGTDLLVTRKRGRQRPVRLQVKFSRGYTPTSIPADMLKAWGWFTLNPKKIAKSNADLWVFIIRTWQHTDHFILIPTRELLERKPRRAGKMWNMYLAGFADGTCYNVRDLSKSEKQLALVYGVEDPKHDYSEYFENWKLLDQMSR